MSYAIKSMLAWENQNKQSFDGSANQFGGRMRIVKNTKLYHGTAKNI